jgi:hypothetical protein
MWTGGLSPDSVSGRGTLFFLAVEVGMGGGFAQIFGSVPGVRLTMNIAEFPSDLAVTFVRYVPPDVQNAAGGIEVGYRTDGAAAHRSPPTTP